MKTILKISELKLNPNNPRIIKDDKYRKLVQSLKEFPEMSEVREIVVNKDYVVLGGNMRLRAMKEAGWTKVPVRIVDWPEEKQKEFIIKDNTAYGDWNWDILANEYEPNDLSEWGVDLPPDWENKIPTPEVPTPNAHKKLMAIVIVAYENLNDLDKITSLYELESIDMTDEIKKQLLGQKKAYVFKQ
jgi:hypothetical protein